MPGPWPPQLPPEQVCSCGDNCGFGFPGDDGDDGDDDDDDDDGDPPGPPQVGQGQEEQELASEHGGF